LKLLISPERVDPMIPSREEKTIEAISASATETRSTILTMSFTTAVEQHVTG
jgi:hypothetical protein